MSRRFIVLGAAVAVALLPNINVQAAPAPAPAPRAATLLSSQAVCPTTASPGHVTCFARALTSNGVRVKPSFATTQPALQTAPSGGYTPADIASAYHLPATAGRATIGIVDAYDDPNAEADLATYRTQFGLLPCTTANGCFRKLNQAGGTTYPAPDPGWATEISLDLDAASAACPSCSLVLIEANDAQVVNVMAGVDQAVTQGATVLSLSFGGPESAAQISQYDPHFSHPGVAIFAASGDSGYGVSYPATSPAVIAVGGTSLRQAPSLSRGWTETVWGPATATAPTTPQGTGSGCSAYEPKPSWQTDTGCAGRTANDVAADADPATGLAAYNSYGTGAPGWAVYGGTSLAAPLMAGISGLAGGTGNTTGAQLFYGTAPLNDISSGTNSLSPCLPAYLCTAQTGYDGPTGNGSPDGVPAAPASTGTAPPPGSPSGGGSTPPPTASPPPDPSVVAVRGGDGGLWVKVSGQGYAAYGGQLLAAPALTATSNGNHLYLVVGTDHRLWERTDSSGFQLADPSGYCLDSPGLYVSGGSATIACEGGDRQLWVNNGSVDGAGIFHSTSWAPYGGLLDSGPTLALVQGQVHFLVEGTDHRVWDRTAGSGFVSNGWACLGHQSVASYAGQAYFACHGTDGQAWSAVNAGGGWSAARPLGGALIDGTGMAAYAGGATLYVEGTDQQVYSLLLDTGAGPRNGAGFVANGGRCSNGVAATAW